MTFDRIINNLGDAIDQLMEKSTPWLIGFSVMYITGHVIVALLKGWL